MPTNTIPANTGGWCNHQGHPNSLGWWDAPNKIPRLVGGFNPIKTVSRDRHFKQCGTWQVCLKPLTRRVAIIIHTSSICAGCIASSMQKRRTHRTRWTVTCCGNRPPGYSNRITMGSYRIARVQQQLRCSHHGHTPIRISFKVSDLHSDWMMVTLASHKRFGLYPSRVAKFTKRQPVTSKDTLWSSNLAMTNKKTTNH